MGTFLFSIAVIAYNNYNYIFETLDSILQQDYPRIELLVSNDASLDFNADEVKRYIEKNKRFNVESFDVWQQPENLGTVKNAEFCRKHAHGQAFYLIAADDVLADPTVVSRFAGEMNKQSEFVGVFSGHVKMCDENLENPRYNWTSGAEVKIIREGDSKRIFSKLSNRTLIPTTGTCYRMSLLERLNGYDTDYCLIEDAPLYLKLARIGAGFCWIDDFVAAKHRDGGTCHSEIDYKKTSYQKYTKDRMRIFKKEVFPYAARVLSIDMEPMLQLWYTSRARYEKSHSDTLLHRILIRLKNTTPFIVALGIFGFSDKGCSVKAKGIAYAKIMKRWLKSIPKRYIGDLKKLVKGTACQG
ncbi:MAG: glycosyltransferase [Oscillospiraceae bacterium]|nr:glycosyltransferase [Oscillospiraceae bacterium]